MIIKLIDYFVFISNLYVEKLFIISLLLKKKLLFLKKSKTFSVINTEIKSKNIRNNELQNLMRHFQ